MSAIIDTSEFIGYINRLEDIQDTTITFDFQFDKSNGADGTVGAVFRAYNDVFALSIAQNRVTIENHAVIIDKPVELQEGEEYTVNCGIKMDYTFSYLLLYVRIQQAIETQAVEDMLPMEGERENEQ